MGLKDLKFLFDNPQPIYYGGQTVSGRLYVNIDTPKKLSRIKIKFKGEAGVHWSESHTEQRTDGRSETVTEDYRGHESYFESSINVWGGTGTAEILPPGEHWYPFSTMLPPNLPTSFEGTYGYVRYTVKATLDRPWKFDHEVKAAFTVLSQVDLNLDLTIQEPSQEEDTKHFCCWCCKSGPLTLVTRIPAGGYVPGQSIPVTIEVDNATNTRIKQVICELSQGVEFHATTPWKKTKHHSVVVSNFKCSAVEENNAKTWTSELDVPPLPPSGLPHCNIIGLQYTLRVKAVPNGPHCELINNISIVIGTIPLWNTQPLPQPSPTAPPPPAGLGFMPSAPLYQDMPPPTYEECMFGTASISDPDDSQYMFGAGGYNPRYPTYTLPQVGWVPPKQ